MWRSPPALGNTFRKRPSQLRRAGQKRPRRFLLEQLEDKRMLAASPVGESDPQFEVYIPDAHRLLEYGRPLTPPAEGDPLDIATSYLQSNLDALGLGFGDLDWYDVTDMYESSHTGVTHVYLQQTHNGLPVVNAAINVNVMPAGQVLNVGSTFISGLRESGMPAPTITADAALVALAEAFDWELDGVPQAISREAGPANRAQFTVFAASGIAYEDISAQLHYVPVSEGTVELAWLLNVQPLSGDHWYDASVSAVDGDLLLVKDWAAHATYNVYATPLESPNFGDRSMQVDPHNPLSSAQGWHDTDGMPGAEFTTTQGNNVHAYTDRNDDNAPDANSSPDGGAPLMFDYPLDLAMEPDGYRDAAVTNLFYVNNMIHDVLYQFGFDEPSGNFQTNNFNLGGLGNDAVDAEAQDGADFFFIRDNANFFTPPDGQNPRMQMYLWTTAAPERDGDLDNGIIFHEYGHGVSNRLTGGPTVAGTLSALQSGGMGEGWSDFLGLMLTQDANNSANSPRGIGTYALNQPTSGPGIRSLPYTYDFTVNDHTYADIIGSVFVHDMGEIWATTLWDLNWALIDGTTLNPAFPTGLGFDPDLTGGYDVGGSGNQLALQLVLDGMKLQPALPTMLDARDAILAADVALTGGVNQGTIWNVFARRGMGFSADDGGDADSTNVTEAFDLPPKSFIRGVKYVDKNQNGAQDGDERGIGGWTIYLDSNDDGQLSGGEPSTVTNAFGQYSFTVDPGSYVVREVMQPLWTQTSPGGDGAYRITAGDQGATFPNNDFGNYPEPGEIHGLVWSDLNQNGARDGSEGGLANITLFLDDDGDGSLTLGEPTTVSAADGSYAFTEVFAGEQTVKQIVPVGMTQTFPVGGGGYTFFVDAGQTVTDKNFGNYFEPATIAGFVWHDLNGDGTRQGSERPMEGIRVYLDTNRDSRLSLSERSTLSNSIGRYEFIVPPGEVVVRVAPMLGFTQSSPADGEGYTILVERNEVLIGNDFGLRGFSADFGDAPTPYPTNFTNDGAAHEFKTTGPRLGSLLTAELSAKASQGATGDDDDGMTFTTAVEAGLSATVEVTASAQGYVSAWIDFDRNNQWEASEKIIASQQVVLGATPFVFDVPETAIGGLSYARIRLSTLQNLLPTGVAPDGEVEDYAVTLINNIPDPTEPGPVSPGPGTPPIPTSFTNPANPADVDDSGSVLIFDAMHIVSDLRMFGSRTLSAPTGPVDRYVDVNGDSRVTLSDALEVVRALILARVAAEASEGEAAAKAIEAPAKHDPSTIELDGDLESSVDLIADDIARL